ncbi:MAG: putative zinc-binding peptidase [Gammaproteobacteria bacterium]|nr:putative zinc-binding peptidase [Gammaproteobacteria bacterium]
MINFPCVCGNTLYFENSQCMSCGRKLGYLSDVGVLSALEPVEGTTYRALSNNRVYRSCRNYHQYEVCNWMIPGQDPGQLCQSCRLNEIIPNLAEGNNIKLWYRVEKAKRRLLYTLTRLGLPVHDRLQDPESGLAFRFMEDDPATIEFLDELSPDERVMTGHSAGTITINLAEADPSAREEIREQMNERYRTLLGHFRHESGHYYWYRLISGGRWLDEFRDLFGDERADYQSALQDYYANGPSRDWAESWISAYASVHPWEDFAETWAHYLHMTDTLETARHYGVKVRGQRMAVISTEAQLASGYRVSMSELMDDWGRLTEALNAMSRSMGLPDTYPFFLTDKIKAKLAMIHRLVSET